MEMPGKELAKNNNGENDNNDNQRRGKALNTAITPVIATGRFIKQRPILTSALVLALIVGGNIHDALEMPHNKPDYEGPTFSNIPHNTRKQAQRLVQKLYETCEAEYGIKKRKREVQQLISNNPDEQVRRLAEREERLVAQIQNLPGLKGIRLTNWCTKQPYKVKLGGRYPVELNPEDGVKDDSSIFDNIARPLNYIPHIEKMNPTNAAYAIIEVTATLAKGVVWAGNEAFHMARKGVNKAVDKMIFWD